MDPIIIVPLALAVAWAASRKKKTTKKTTPGTPPELPDVLDDPAGPFEGPGPEPWRPGGPGLPKPPPPDGPVGPKPFPGPGHGPLPPNVADPSPTEIYPGTHPSDIEEHDYAAYGLFISSDCETVYEGSRWWEDVFVPQARALVLGQPEAYHHPVAVIYELLVMPEKQGADGETPAQSCIAAWEEFIYGDVTPMGTLSGWITDRSDPSGEYWDYQQWFSQEYPSLWQWLSDLYANLWADPDMAEVFDREWPGDEPPGDLDFEPTGS